MAEIDDATFKALWKTVARFEKNVTDFRDIVACLHWRFLKTNFKHTDTAFCIGNGESRIGINLDYFKDCGVVFGCNALYRDWIPDVLVAVDHAMQREIVKAKLQCFVFRADLAQKALVPLGDKVFPPVPYPNYASGPSSILLACVLLQINLRRVFLVGHDFFGHGPEINNIYKGTPNYRPRDAEAANSDNWVIQTAEIVDAHPDVHFYRCGPPLSGRTKRLEGRNNFHFISFKEMEQLIT